LSARLQKYVMSPSTTRITESIVVLLPLRLVLGGLFIFAAYTKISDPQEFVFNINAYGVFDRETQEHVIKLLGFAIPWAEMIVGVALVLGVWARGAAALLALQLFAFTIGILNVIASGKELSCGCFGGFNVICTGDVGWCHAGRNGVLFLLSVLLAWRGAGVASIDGLLTRPRPIVDEDADEA